MKRLVKNIFRSLGYELHQPGHCTDVNTLHMGSGKYFPYVEKYRLNGCEFDFWIVNEEMQQLFCLDQINDDAEILELMKIINPGDRILEIGVQHGFFTMILAKMTGKNGVVLGVEALPANVLVAQSQINLNRLSEYCDVKNVALSDSSGEVNISRMSSNASVVNNGVHNAVTIPADTGDNLFDKYGKFDLVKIDVEGYEKKVLDGCKKLLANKPKLALELHVPFLKKYNCSVDDIVELIGLENYVGKMIFRSNKTAAVPYERRSINNEVINLILVPKK